MKFEHVLYSVADSKATITLNSPHNLNAFNEGMIRDVTEALECAEADEAVKVIVIDAEGKAFSGGGDIGEMGKALDEGKTPFDVTVGLIAELSRKIKTIGKPVITSVRGAAAGAAFNLALASDFCVAAENAKFIQAFVGIGLVPDAGGMYLLTRAVGVNKAVHLAMLGTPVTAAEALEYGFVYQVCPVEALGAETDKLAARLAAGPSKAYARIKEQVLAAQFGDFEEYIKVECAAQIASGNTKDYEEGIRAFLEKRKPVFTGK